MNLAYSFWQKDPEKLKIYVQNCAYKSFESIGGPCS